MTAATYPALAYQAAEAATADPAHTVVLLWDTAVRSLDRAREGMVHGDYYEQCQGIVHAQRILTALMSALDGTHQPELAHNLFALYNWLHGRLTQASLGNDMAALGEAIEVASRLRDAWRQAEANCRAEGLPSRPLTGAVRAA